MQKINELERLYAETEKRYRNRNLDFDLVYLYRRIDDLYHQSRVNYLKLLNPKTCSRAVYTDIWIWGEIGIDIAKKEVGKPFKFNNPPPEYKFAVDFLKRYPAEYVKEIRNKKVKMTEKSLIDMNKRYIRMVKERNNFSLSKGYGSRVEMYLKKYKITNFEYKKFLKNADKVILNCNKKLLKLENTSDLRISKHCYICEFNEILFKRPKDLVMFFGKDYSILRKNMKRINVKFTDCSETKYIKENDSFKITIDKNIKANHQKIDLIHELAHVVSYLEGFKKGINFLKKGRYFREKKAIKIELNFLEKYYPNMFTAKLGNILHGICQILFEIELYQSPNRNQSEEYATCLNRCFKNEKQKINYDYLLNPDILYESFSLLPYAVAYVNVLAKYK